MKIKPIYIYLGVFVIFVVAVILFSSATKNSKTAGELNSNSQMPNDDVHKGMVQQGSGEMPSKSNVMKEALEKMNALKVAIEKNPNDTSKVREYAEMVQVHDPIEAIRLYENILKAGPKRIDILLELTFLYFNKGDLKKSEEYNKKVLDIDGTNMIANYNLGGLAQAKGDIKTAKAIWSGIAKKYPNTQIGSMAGELAKQLDQMPPKK
jgi:tetratricopeptide (TPR) repeat protein